MKQIGLSERMINFCAHKFLLGLVATSTLVGLTDTISHDVETTFESSAFLIDFAKFSPAFAAFEDDYLFNVKSSGTLKAGAEPTTYLQLADSKTKQQTVTTQVVEIAEDILSHFDGDTMLSVAKQELRKIQASYTKEKPETLNAKAIESEEISFGSLAALANPESGSAGSNRANSAKSKPATTGAPKNKPFNPFDDGSKKQPVVDSLVVRGGIQLKDGLAFVGSMEVSWVVGDYELQVGSINIPDASFEIEISKPMGDIIVSLYDSNDELIGEGVYDLSGLSFSKEHHDADIAVYPIDWDTAGLIVDSNSIGHGVSKPIEGAEIALYAFNDSAITSEDGQFNFHNWKKAESRTLAIASKDGYRDSIFMLDSKEFAKVYLFPEKYIRNLIDTISSQMTDSIENSGIIYGEISGIEDKSGFIAKIENNSATYIQTGVALTGLKSTTSNGLFTFVDLPDGDYELLIEKDGEVVDTRLIVVEQGKVSPVTVNLAKTIKHLEFFDPFLPDKKLSHLAVSFFDGVVEKQGEDDNLLKININKGHDLNHMEIDTYPSLSSTLISRNKGMQRIPFLTDDRLLKLAEDNDLKIEEGLIFGFIQADEVYKVALVESSVDKVIYFDKQANPIDPTQQPAYGFMIGGFHQGLNSVVVETVSDNTVVASDIIFSEHSAISVIHLNVLP